MIEHGNDWSKIGKVMGRNQDDCKTTFRNMKERGVKGEFSSAENVDILLQINRICKQQLQESKNLDIKEVSWQSIATSLCGRRTALDYLRHWDILRRQILISAWQFNKQLYTDVGDKNFAIWYDIGAGVFRKVDASSSPSYANSTDPNLIPINLEKNNDFGGKFADRMYNNNKEAIVSGGGSSIVSGGGSSIAFAAATTTTTTTITIAAATAATAAICGKNGDGSKNKSNKRALGSLENIENITDIAPDVAIAGAKTGVGSDAAIGDPSGDDDRSLRTTGRKRIRNMGPKGLVDCLIDMNPASIAEIDWNCIDRCYLNNRGSSIRLWNDLNSNLKRELAKLDTESLRDKLVYIRSLL